MWITAILHRNIGQVGVQYWQAVVVVGSRDEPFAYLQSVKIRGGGSVQQAKQPTQAPFFLPSFEVQPSSTPQPLDHISPIIRLRGDATYTIK